MGHSPTARYPELSFNIEYLLRQTESIGEIARVVVADTAGSTPREAGAAMVVWQGGQSGTIGGGALELQASNSAKRMLADQHKNKLLQRLPLGPNLGQCCGGSVTILTERFDTSSLQDISAMVDREGWYARSATSDDEDRPLAVDVYLQERNAGRKPFEPTYISGWMIEPARASSRQIWVYGAGHVGRAIVSAVVPMSEFAVTWIDVTDARFPEQLPKGVEKLIAANPADVVSFAPADTDHLVLTFSHALDLEICNKLVAREFRTAGLIGSATKWARFRKRLIEAGHNAARVDRIDCPIGDPSLGKHPWAIALGVASSLLSDRAQLGKEEFS